MGKKRFYYKGISWCMFLIFMISFICTPVFAIDLNKKNEVAKFEEMVDRYMKKSMGEYRIPGVTVVAVKDGEVLLKKGYGYADIENKIPVDPEKTLFRIGSVTKLFTATAVMQLVEQGKIDLNTDINHYLNDVKIDNKYNTPITMGNLLTHTGGFDESGKEFFSDELLDYIKPLEETINNSMPPMIRRPGEIVQYSNHGYALIGYIVEQVSGMSFDKYVEENIFTPLNMNSSSYFLSPNTLDSLAKGYTYEKDNFKSQQLHQIFVHPAGSICSTSDDMAKFLIAHLQNGTYKDYRILKENTAIDMHSNKFTHNDLFSGQGYGFYQKYYNRKIIEHDGDTPYFASKLSLYPENNIGFFISYNSPDAEDIELRDEFAEKFYEFFGIKEESSSIVGAHKPFKENLERYKGDYRYVRTVRSYYDKIKFIFFKLKVRVNRNGELYVKSPEEHNGKYTQVGENLFKNKENDRYIYFKKDNDGKQYLICDGEAARQACEKLSTRERVIESFIGPFFIIITLLGCILSVINLFRKKKNKYTGMTLWAKRISSFTCLFILILVVSVFMFIFNDRNMIFFIYFIGIIITISSVLMLIIGVSIWKKGLMNIWNGIFYTLVTLAAIGSVIYMNYMKLLPWN